MTTMAKWLAALCCVAALSACGGSNGAAGSAAPASTRRLGTCTAYKRGGDYDGMSGGSRTRATKAECATAGGVWVAECPAADRLATCDVSGLPGWEDAWYPGLYSAAEELQDPVRHRHGPLHRRHRDLGPGRGAAHRPATCSSAHSAWTARSSRAT